MRMQWSVAAAAGAALTAAGCATQEQSAASAAVTVEAMQPALESVTVADLMRRTAALAHDSMEGRAPGGTGEERTVRYLENEMRTIGLGPGNPDGTYVQNVPLVGLTADVDAHLTIDGRTVQLEGPRDFIAETRRVVPEVSVENSDLVFVGYGVVAPEYGP